MKIKTMLVLALLIITSGIFAQTFNSPESAAYDPDTDTYFISNYAGNSIVRIDAAGEKTVFIDGLSHPLGMVLENNTLYLIDNPNSVKGFTLDGNKVLDVTVNKARFLNDITSDGAGTLYVTDSQTSTLYKIDIAAKTSSLLIKLETGNSNGIAWDKQNNRIITCHFHEQAEITAVDPQDGSATTLTETGIDNLDGIGIDMDGYFYISSWAKGNFTDGFPQKGVIYKFDNAFKDRPKVIMSNLHSPADIFYNTVKKELAVPLFLDNDVIFVKVNE